MCKHTQRHTHIESLLAHLLKHILHPWTCTHRPTHKHVRNGFLSIRTNGTEHLHFLIMALILPHLNVSPSIVATHHFHSNPPKEMDWNFLLSCALLRGTITFSVHRHQG
ncbi:hypothetical protein XENOCAPTIV_018451 [Xenoophorus captivus]|uniref:Uncharacterized protein n=2 Tax=Goodeidae TaxID=28758 RepID=A0ABV0QKI0_9TELE